jgi:peptidoglycan/xylan/chitin deacetylase (PgdA/CDA1 family)
MTPAFGLHAITAERLRPLLAFLAENRYRTLTMNEYVERRTLGRRERAHDVLLTFDDGHRSLYTDVFPLLRDYGFCATAYVVPGEIPGTRKVPTCLMRFTGSLCCPSGWDARRI